jgi:uncharacterized protein (TIGR00288 family)
MLRLRLRTAVFIDYENVHHGALPKTIPNWTAWLESGEFDPKRRRRTLVVKRIYWNSQTDHLRPRFKQFGFVPVLCEKYAQLKNGADIRITIDIVESTVKNPNIDEYILVTKDSDFVPVLQMLTQKKKQTAVLVDPSKPTIHTTYRRHADIVIPVQDFMAATTFSAQSGGRMRRAFALIRDRINSFTTQRHKRRAAERAAAQAAAAAEAASTERDALLDLAVDHLIKVTSLLPNQATAARKIEKELGKLQGFATTGKAAYLGYRTYQDLMREIARRTDRIKITPATGGGISVSYVPKDEEE